MSAPYAHDDSPPRGSAIAPVADPRDGGEASRGLTAGEQSLRSHGRRPRLARRMFPHADADRPVRRGNPGWPLHDTRPLNVAQQTSPHSKEA